MHFYKLDFQTWFNLRQQSHFGHAQYPHPSPVKRLGYVVNEVLNVDRGSHNIVYLVADEFEKALLTSAVRLEFPRLLGESRTNNPQTNFVAILDYSSVCNFLQIGKSWSGWKRDNVTFVCEVDIHYSAAFATAFISLLLWCRNPCSRSKLRVLTLSGVHQPEPSLVDAMNHMWPGPWTFSLVEFSAPHQQSYVKWERSTWSRLEDTDGVTDSAIRSSAPSIIVGRVDAAHWATERLQHVKHQFRINGMGDGEHLIEYIKKRDEYPPLIALVNPSRLIFPAYNHTRIVVLHSRLALQWQHGRVVEATALISKREIDELEYGIYFVPDEQQQSAPDLRILAPPGTRPPHPPRRLEDDQILGFIAMLAISLRGTIQNLYEVLACFVTTGDIVRAALFHLEIVGFIREQPNLEVPPRQLPNSKLRQTMVRLLPTSYFDFDSYWFLAMIIESDAASTEAKKAAFYMSALIQVGAPIFDPEKAGTLVMTAQKRGMMDALAGLLGPQHLPSWVLGNGWLWLALGCLYYYDSKEEGDPSRLVIDAKSVQIKIGAPVAERVRQRAKDLMRSANCTNLFARKYTAHLNDQDVDLLYTFMIKAWARRCLLVEKASPDSKEVTITDMLRRTCNVPRARSGVRHFLNSEYIFTSGGPKYVFNFKKGNSLDAFFIIPLHIRDVDKEFMYDCSILLPMRLVRNWRNHRGGDIFWGLLSTDER